MSGEQGGALTPRTFAALPSRKCISPSPLFVPPLFSVCLVEMVAAGWPLCLSGSLCRTYALLRLPGLGYLAKRATGDQISRRQRGAVFSHTLLLFLSNQLSFTCIRKYIV